MCPTNQPLIVKKPSTIALLLLSVCLLCNFCTEIFYPEINSELSILVVDGKITNSGEQAVVRLFRTVDLIQNHDVKPEVDALVTLHDDLGNVDIMNETIPGVYINTKNSIKGIPGQSYWIEITTSNGDKFESTPEQMPDPFTIDSLYGIEEVRITESGNKERGVRFYFDAKSTFRNANYLRWEYIESYEWRAPEKLNTKKYTEHPARICYPVVDYNNINVFNASQIIPKIATQLSTSFIAVNEVKLQYQYLLKVSLYCVTKDNYIFWDRIKATNSSNGDIYDTTPANINGNINSCNDCKAIGYFEASTINVSQSFFSVSDFTTKFRDYPEECETIDMLMSDGRPDPNIFHILRTKPGGKFATIYVVRRIECYECNKIYPVEKPSFWPNNK